MEEIIELIAKELANKNKVLKFTEGSVFNLVDINEFTDESIGMIANKLATSALNDVNKFKNVYLQEAIEYSKAVKKELSTFDEMAELNKYKIIERYIPSILDYYQDKNILTPKRAIRELPIGNVSIPKPEDEVIESYLKVNNPIEQKYIDAVISEYGDIKNIDRLWDKYLTNISSSNINIEALSFKLADEIYEIILLSIIVKKLKDTKPTGVTTPDTTYRRTMNDFYSELLNYMSMFISDYKDAVKLNIVVIKRVNDNEIIVNRTVYEKLLDDVTSDVMLGYIVNGSKYKFLNEIKINSDSLSKAWGDKVKLTRVTNNINMIKRYKTAYATTMNKIYPDPDNGVSRYDSVMFIFESCSKYENYKDSDILNIDKTTSFLIGMIIYPDSLYLRFMELMEEHMAIDKTLSTVEAASLATIGILIDYLLMQVETESI